MSSSRLRAATANDFWLKLTIGWSFKMEKGKEEKMIRFTKMSQIVSFATFFDFLSFEIHIQYYYYFKAEVHNSNLMAGPIFLSLFKCQIDIIYTFKVCIYQAKRTKFRTKRAKLEATAGHLLRKPAL